MWGDIVIWSQMRCRDSWFPVRGLYLPMVILVSNRRCMLWEETAMKNSVFDSFSLSLFLVIQVRISLAHIESLKMATAVSPESSETPLQELYRSSVIGILRKSVSEVSEHPCDLWHLKDLSASPCHEIVNPNSMTFSGFQSQLEPPK